MSAPSYEQLAALVAAQERTIAQLQSLITEQDAEIAELKRRLAAGWLLGHPTATATAYRRDLEG